MLLWVFFGVCVSARRLRYMVHSKTRTSVQLGILLGLSGDSGDGMGGGGQRRRVWEGGGGAVLCVNLANQMQEGYIGARHFQTGQK